MKKSFYDFFPTPKFLSMQSVGLSIQDSGIAFVELVKKSDNKISLESYGREKIPDEILENGEIKDSKKLIEILSEFKKKHNLNFVRSTIPEEKAFLFKQTLPKMPKEEIRDALRFKVEENVPFSVEDAIFDFQIIKDKNSQKKNNKKDSGINVVVSVIPKNVVFNYLEVLKSSGLTPLLFETESQAITRSIISSSTKGASLIVNVKSDKTGLYIVYNSVVHFASSVDLGSDYFSSTDISDFSRLEEKKEEGFTKVFTKTDKKGDLLKNESNKLMDYWNASNDSPDSTSKIEKIIICGHNLSLTGNNIRNYFNSAFSVSVEMANVWKNVFEFDEYIPDITFSESFEYSAAIGLAIPENKK